MAIGAFPFTSSGIFHNVLTNMWMLREMHTKAFTELLELNDELLRRLVWQIYEHLEYAEEWT
jgi:hypothetical protein